MAKVSLKEVLAKHPDCGDGKSFKKLIDTCPWSSMIENPNHLSSWKDTFHLKFIVGGHNGYLKKNEIPHKLKFIIGGHDGYLTKIGI